MNVLNVHKGQDTGAWGHRLEGAFARHAPEITFDSFYAPNSFLYLDYPMSRRWDAGEIRRLWREADVVHLHNGFRTARIFGNRKPMVVHYHGTDFRQNPRQHLAQLRQQGATAVVSTLDLHLISPGELEWLPSPYDLEWLASMAKGR